MGVIMARPVTTIFLRLFVKVHGEVDLSPATARGISQYKERGSQSSDQTGTSEERKENTPLASNCLTPSKRGSEHKKGVPGKRTAYPEKIKTDYLTCVIDK